MSSHNLLVVLLPDGSEAQLRRAVDRRATEGLRVHVVAPTRLGPLEWLASDEDDARREADIRALTAEWTLADRADIDGSSGDVDSELAVEDALRTFPAEEILIAGGSSENGALEHALRRFGLPVTQLSGPGAAPNHPRLHEAIRSIIAGRSRATPFVFFVGVNLALFGLAVLIAIVVLLVVWVR